MHQKLVYIEAQRLFRKHKHGMDVVALELLQRLRNCTPSYGFVVVVKAGEDVCLQGSDCMKVSLLKSCFYPLWEQWLLPKQIKKNTKSLLHCTGNTAPLLTRNPLLITIHDLIFLEKNYLFSKNGGSLYQRFGNYYRRLVVPLVARKAKHIITVSDFQRNYIINRLKINPEKISVVYNGVDNRFFQHTAPSKLHVILKKYGLNFPYIFFMGNTEPRKNTRGVIEAFKIFCEQNPEQHQRLAIKGLTASQLHEKVKQCGAEKCADRIHRLGYIAHDDLPLIYQGADVLWFPSFSEGFGLPIIESMASGTPVITSSVSVMPEIAADAALYTDPTKPCELAAQTQLLLSNTTFRSSIIQKGLKRATFFTWEKSAADLLKIYDHLVKDI